LRDDPAEFGHVAADMPFGDRVGAEHAAVEQPSRTAGFHPELGFVPETIDLGFQRRVECRHLAHDSHAHRGQQGMHHEPVHP
jgi:hypothetical protein